MAIGRCCGFPGGVESGRDGAGEFRPPGVVLRSPGRDVDMDVVGLVPGVTLRHVVGDMDVGGLVAGVTLRHLSGDAHFCCPAFEEDKPPLKLQGDTLRGSGCEVEYGGLARPILSG